VRVELVLFPQGEHDDLFDGVQTMVEGQLLARWFRRSGTRRLRGGGLSFPATRPSAGQARRQPETRKNLIDGVGLKEQDMGWRKSDPSSYGVGCYGYS